MEDKKWNKNLFTTVTRWKRRKRLAKRKQLNYLSGTFLELRNYCFSIVEKVVCGPTTKLQYEEHSGRFDWRSLLSVVTPLHISLNSSQQLERISAQPQNTQDILTALGKYVHIQMTCLQVCR